MKKNNIILLILLLLIISACEKAVVSTNISGEISTNEDPEQQFVDDVDDIIINNDSGKFSISPVAEYDISARVVSARSYSRKWTASLSPMDLALVWGRLEERGMDDYISYKQRNRWYFYRYSHDCPVDNNYIITHSSNNHIIPASYNLSLALKNIKKNDHVRVEGYLVRITGFSKKRKVNWGTSTTRKDSGDRSCELIYAKTIRVNERVYR